MRVRQAATAVVLIVLWPSIKLFEVWGRWQERWADRGDPWETD